MNNENKGKSTWLKPIITIVIILIIATGLITGYTIYMGKTVDSVVYIDANPSLQLKVNKNEEVIEIKPLNHKGKEITGDIDFNKSNLEVTINALIISMINKNYINEVDNSILISVKNKDDAKGYVLQIRLGDIIYRILQENSIKGAIITQTLSDDGDFEPLVDTDNISPGKVLMVRNLVKSNDKYKFEDLMALSINQLNLLREANKTDDSKDISVGSASEEPYIGSDNAFIKAMEDAGVLESEIRDLDVDFEYDDGKTIYEVEFYANGKEYEYKIDAITGAVIKSDIDYEDR